MTATVAASKAYDLSGGALREDLSDIIYDISPMETVFMSRAGRGTAKSTTHEWLTDSLASQNAKNAAIEGDEFTAVARTLPSRLKNYTQISRKNFEVTGTAQKVNNAGMRELLAYHTAQAGKEMKRDIEAGLLSDEPASAGTSVSARVSAGAEAWIYTPNHIAVNQSAATTTAPVSGFATSPVTDGTATAFTETGLKSMLQQAWSMGGEVDTILVGATLYNTISGFTGLATRFRDVASGQQAQIIGAADVYVSAYGRHNIQLSRYARSTTVFCLDMKTWQVDYLRPFQTVEIAKIGDAERRMLLAEYTLVCKTPMANTKATGVS
jgi:hypothetical protein